MFLEQMISGILPRSALDSIRYKWRVDDISTMERHNTKECPRHAVIQITNYIDISAGGAWKWSIEKIDENIFLTSFDDMTYTYPLSSLDEIINLIAFDHVKRHRPDDDMIIESNLGFTRYECKGKEVHKHIKDSLILFKAVRSIEKASQPQSKMFSDYLTL